MRSTDRNAYSNRKAGDNKRPEETIGIQLNLNACMFCLYFVTYFPPGLLRLITYLFTCSSTRQCDGFTFNTVTGECAHYFDVGFLSGENLVQERGINFHALERCDAPPTSPPTVDPSGKFEHRVINEQAPPREPKALSLTLFHFILFQSICFTLLTRIDQSWDVIDVWPRTKQRSTLCFTCLYVNTLLYSLAPMNCHATEAAWMLDSMVFHIYLCTYLAWSSVGMGALTYFSYFGAQWYTDAGIFSIKEHVFEMAHPQYV